MISVSRVEPSPEVLATYAAISTTFKVRSRAEPRALDNGAVVEVPIAAPYTKDAADEDPREWPWRYDLEQWALFIANDGTGAVGGCSVATGLQSRYFVSSPLAAILWDVRVRPEHRGIGAGKALLDAGVAWARDAGCDEILIETQDTNVAACRLYLSCGFTVRSLQPGAYAEWRDDILVVFRRALR
jgi:ribosomal protein S18 acetylase RimI-like enzyme